MSSLLKICRSIVKKNIGFSICLCLMSLLSFVTSILAANFASSAKGTIDNFFRYTGVPDALISTKFMNVDELDEIKTIEGIEQISDRLVFDTNIKTKDEKHFSSRLLTYDETGPYKLEFQKSGDISEEKPKVYVSYEFADYNDILIGDTILLITPFGDYEVNVGATISSVETFKCIKDEMSNYETYQFGYIYFPKNELAKIYGVLDITNSFSIYFKDGISKEHQRNILKEVKDKLGINFVSNTIVSEMASIKSIEDDINTIKVLCVFVPGVVLLISLGFSFIFLKIIISNQGKTIALLKSLGYTSRKIVAIFILFTLMINIVALILGLPLGFLVLRICVGLIASANGILNVLFNVSYGIMIGLIFLVFAIGVLASLLTSNSITKIDPASVSYNENNKNISTPKFAQKINCNPFLKVSLVAILRKFKRLIVGALCMAACIITMCVGFEGNLSIARPITAVYGERFRYNLMVRDVNESEYVNISSNINNIDIIEPLSFFESNVGDKTINVSSIKENSELIVLKDARGNIVYPGDGVVVDEMYAKTNHVNNGDTILLGGHNLQVTGIAREISVPFFYISQETAEKIYSAPINCILIKADNETNIDYIKKQILSINSDAYFSIMSSQKENMDSRCKAMRIIMLILSALSFLIGSLFVFNITIIDFNEKKSEYAILRAIGASINKLSVVSLIENLTRLLLGIVLAVPLSYLFVTILLELLSVESAQYVLVNFWPCLLLAVGISLLYIVVSLLISRRAIRKMNMVEKLNEEE